MIMVGWYYLVLFCSVACAICGGGVFILDLAVMRAKDRELAVYKKRVVKLHDDLAGALVKIQFGVNHRKALQDYNREIFEYLNFLKSGISTSLDNRLTAEELAILGKADWFQPLKYMNVDRIESVAEIHRVCDDFNSVERMDGEDLAISCSPLAVGEDERVRRVS